MRPRFRRCVILAVFVLSACGVNSAERNDTGINLYDQGDYPSAINAYQAAQVASPDQAVPYLNAASAYAESGEFDKAIAALQQALKTASDDLAEQIYYNLGNVYFEMRQFEDAITAYQQALLRNPSDSDARYNLELALKQIFAITPTHQSQDSTPTADGSGGQPTPTPQLQFNSASPTPQENSANQSDALTPTLSITLSVEDAENLLDAIQQNQQTLQQVQATPSTDDSGKDW
jgi:tetratricopeptide (TPR) repeat protein